MKPRVFHLLTRFLIGGGAQAETIEVISRLKGRYDFCVGFGAPADVEQIEQLRRMGVRIQEFPLMRHLEPGRLLLSTFQICEHLRSHHFDIVHTHNTEAGIVGRLAAVLARVPVVVHSLHGDIFVGRNLWLRGTLSLVERLLARKTTRFFSNADSITRTYLDRQIGRKGQFTTIRTAVDLDFFRNASPVRFDFPDDVIRVLMVSRIIRDKGFCELILAARTVLKMTDRRVVFLVVGEGEFLPVAKRLVDDYRLQQSFRFYRTMRRENLAGTTKSSHLFVLPSYREGIPRVMIEAMAAGLPVIATRVGGIPEVIHNGQNGLLVKPGSVEELVSALMTMIEDDHLRYRCGEAARKSVDEFDANSVVDKIDMQYQSLLANSLR